MNLDDELSQGDRETRQRLVHRAVDDWKRQLIDLGGRNNLLYFKDLKVGTLDLDTAAPEAMNRLLSGRKVRLADLFPEFDRRRDAARRSRTLRAKAVENRDERGLQTLRVARSFATWTSERSAATPNAPVLLYDLDMRPTGVAADDFELQLSPDPELNPTLVHLLATDFDVHLDDEVLGELESDNFSPTRLNDRLISRCRAIPGFAIQERIVVGNFSYAKLPMVRDLERSESEIEAHDLLAAVAGDVDARQALRTQQTTADNAVLTPVPPPTDEFLVLDADSSQSYAIAAAVAGSNLVIIGPPGTGKSQTISNLIATLVARGKSVLFVAEKRAAIEAVISRLDRRGLAELILDLHEGAANRRRIASELNRALSATSGTRLPEVGPLHQRLERRRDQLEGYAEALNKPAEPWDISPFDAQSRLIGLGDTARFGHRIHGAVLDALTPSVIAQVCDDARRFVTLGGFGLLHLEGPWARTYAARRVTDSAAAASVQHLLQEALHVRLPAFQRLVAAATGAKRLRPPRTLDEATALVSLLRDVSEADRVFTAGVFDLDLPRLVTALRPAKSLAPIRLTATLFNHEYKQAKHDLRLLARDPQQSDPGLLRLTALASDVAATWKAWLLDQDGRPTPFSEVEALAEAGDALRGTLRQLVETATVAFNIDTTPISEIEKHLLDLDRERVTLARLPELHHLEDRIRASGLGDVLDEATQQSLSPSQASDAIERVWLSSILDRLTTERPALAAFDSVDQETAVEEFQLADQAHIETTVERVRRAWAERVVAARNAWPDEAQVVARQAALQRRHMPLRDFFDQAEHVLTAVKPCWVMSPLVVAQVLPARACFDVVVFDEASQVPPADAACSLLRSHQAVIAGDPHQLPPTSFFSSGLNDGDDGDEEEWDEEFREAAGGALTSDIESILDVMRSLLPGGQKVLNWHYRSKDERLITFSNAQESLYDWSLTTFPGALPGDCMRHVLVPFVPGAAKVTASVPQEAERVVELALEHVTERPDESLGIIALGSAHANRITELLRLSAVEHPALAEAMDEDCDEPLFVKNLERVQGDERDAIILTTGYGKTVDGRMRYVFGPVNQEGGHRRLNVAVTRARRRMTVVSSFSGREMDPDRLHSVGARMLRDYLLYAESGGSDLGIRAKAKPPLNAFERDVQEQLAARGLRMTPQFGASGYWIDFVVMHPDRPSEPVLAIEADGASYHSSPSARDRDRLRQEHLERLGWRFHRIWSTDWFRDREQEIERAVAAYRAALSAPEGGATTPMNELTPEAPPDWLPPPPSEMHSGRSRLSVRPGRPITDYRPSELRQVVRWVKSDGRLYTDQEILTEAMEALGFRRQGSRIVSALNAAITAERNQ